MPFKKSKIAVSVCSLIVAGLALTQARPASAQQPGYRLVAADLVGQGERFTVRVSELTAKGDQALGPGDKVVFRGQVVEVEPGGKVLIPPFLQEVGSVFFVARVVRGAGGPRNEAVSTVSHHIQVVRLPAGVSAQIKRASQIISSRLRVEGQGLDSLHGAVLAGGDGKQFALGDSVGSSLQRIYQSPDTLPPGSYRFVAFDAAGHRLEAPNPSVRPKLLGIKGDRIRHRGQRGKIQFKYDVDTYSELRGGEPTITLDRRNAFAPANQWVNVAFQAEQLGTYDVVVAPVGWEEVPIAGQAPVDAHAGTLQARYDAARNSTEVSFPIHVADSSGQAVKDAAVDVAVIHPVGIEYARVTTGKDGTASFVGTVPGHLEPSLISAAVYRVLGHGWTQAAPAPQEAPPACTCTATYQGGIGPVKVTLSGNPGASEEAIRRRGPMAGFLGWIKVSFTVPAVVITTTPAEADINVYRRAWVELGGIEAGDLNAWVLWQPTPNAPLKDSSAPPNLVRLRVIPCGTTVTLPQQDVVYYLALYLKPDRARPDRILMSIVDQIDPCAAHLTDTFRVELKFDRMGQLDKVE